MSSSDRWCWPCWSGCWCSPSGLPASRTRRPNATTSISRRASAASTRARPSPSRAFRSARSSRFRCFPSARNSSGCGSRSMTKRPVLQGTTAQIKGVGFTGVSEIQLDGAVKGAPPIDPGRPAGLPGHPVELGRARRVAQQRAGADRPNPAADRAADRIAQRQEPELDRRHPRECRHDHQGAGRARAGPGRRHARRADRRAQRRHCRAATSPSWPTAPTGWSTNRAGRPPRTCARRSPRSSRPPTISTRWSPMRGPGVQNFTKSTLPEANQLVRDLRELTESLQGGVRPRRPGRHRRRARAREAARLQARKADEADLRLAVPVALALALGGCSLAACSAAARLRRPC